MIRIVTIYTYRTASARDTRVFNLNAQVPTCGPRFRDTRER